MRFHHVASPIILRIGSGTFPTLGPQNSTIALPSDFCNLVPDQSTLIETIYPNLEQNHRDIDWLSGRAILATTNAMIKDLNIIIKERLTVQSRIYSSVDLVVDEHNNADNIDNSQIIHFPMEFLNTLTPNGFPPHKLILKVGSPIMMLRNSDPPKLCNGTRLVVRSLENNLIRARIIVGQFKDEDVLIPRIPLISDEIVRFKRHQFPVALCYAMTINKS